MKNIAQGGLNSLIDSYYHLNISEIEACNISYEEYRKAFSSYFDVNIEVNDSVYFGSNVKEFITNALLRPLETERGEDGKLCSIESEESDSAFSTGYLTRITPMNVLNGIAKPISDILIAYSFEEVLSYLSRDAYTLKPICIDNLEIKNDDLGFFVGLLKHNPNTVVLFSNCSYLDTNKNNKYSPLCIGHLDDAVNALCVSGLIVDSSGNLVIYDGVGKEHPITFDMKYNYVWDDAIIKTFINTSLDETVECSDNSICDMVDYDNVESGIELVEDFCESNTIGCRKDSVISKMVKHSYSEDYDNLSDTGDLN
jgi:hypothetical protein